MGRGPARQFASALETSDAEGGRTLGRDRARKDKVEFILKGREGQIRKKDSYGSDPRRSKGY